MCSPFSYLDTNCDGPLDMYKTSFEIFHHPDRPDIDTFAKRAGIIASLTIFYMGSEERVSKINLYKREGIGDTPIHILKGDGKYVSMIIPNIERFYNFIRDEHSKIGDCAKVWKYLKTFREYGELIQNDTRYPKTGVINLSIQEIDILYVNGSDAAKRFWLEVVINS